MYSSCNGTDESKSNSLKQTTNGTYLNKLDKFAQYQIEKQEKKRRKARIQKTLKEMNLDLQLKQTTNNLLNLYDSPKISRIPFNNYLKKSENEKLKEEIIELKTQVINLKIENNNLRSTQTKHKQFIEDLNILIRQNL